MHDHDIAVAAEPKHLLESGPEGVIARDLSVNPRSTWTSASYRSMFCPSLLTRTYPTRSPTWESSNLTGARKDTRCP